MTYTPMSTQSGRIPIGVSGTSNSSSSFSSFLLWTDDDGVDFGDESDGFELVQNLFVVCLGDNNNVDDNGRDI